MFKGLIRLVVTGAIVGFGASIGYDAHEYLRNPHNKAKIKRVVKNIKDEFKKKTES